MRAWACFSRLVYEQLDIVIQSASYGQTSEALARNGKMDQVQLQACEATYKYKHL